jgi:hypothetical protein
LSETKRSDLAEYLLDNYGVCDRDADCYWGKDEYGLDNGCLRLGWRGRKCKHWHPMGVTSWNELHKAVEDIKP